MVALRENNYMLVLTLELSKTPPIKVTELRVVEISSGILRTLQFGVRAIGLLSIVVTNDD